MFDRYRSVLVGTFVLGLATAALCHDDDPKLRTAVRQVKSKGYLNAWVGNPAGAGDTIEVGGGGFPADGITLLAWLPLSSFGSPGGGNDCWGYTSPSGREYALFGHTAGTAFVEITSPGNPTIVANMPPPNGVGTSTWRDVKVYGSWCYVVTESGGGIQVFNLANIDAGQVVHTDTVTSGGTTATHNVALNEASGFLYRCGGSNEGLRIYTLADPSKPTHVATWSTKYVHDAQIVSYTSGPYAGKEVAFCFSGFNGGWDQPGVDILDVTNKQNIQVMSSFQYPSAAYSHQGWLSEDLQTLFIGDELDEQGSFNTRTYIYNVANLASPSYLGLLPSTTPAVGHNMYTVNGLIYQANYRAGLEVYDITNPAAPVKTAYFDTYPTSNSAEFNGMWSCYPYFPSGIVIGSDRDSGLFIWWPGDAELMFDYPNGLPALLAPAGQSFQVTISELNPGDYVPGTATLHYDAGSGWQSVPMSSQGGGSFLASFPAIPCGSQVSYYVSAEGDSGVTWSDPGTAPMDLYQALSGAGVANVENDEMESDAGWTVGAPGDTAATGVWTRVNPNGTGAQPEDDHTPAGAVCWVTGQGNPGGGDGDNDIDGGATSLLSPIYDMSNSASPIVTYWRWFSTTSSSDTWVVSISNNGGANWVQVESLNGSHEDSDGGWIEHSFAVTDFVTLTANVRLRFTAADNGSGSIVEAALDDLTIDDVECDSCDSVNYCVTAPNSNGSGALIASLGSTSLASNTFFLDVTAASTSQNGIFFYGPNQTQLPFGDGFRCVGGGTFRLNPAASTDAFGDYTRQLDFNQSPANSGPGQILPGSVWNFQFWYRDPQGPGGNGFNLSNGLSVTFCP